jgi:hypothetical protein
MMKRTGVVRDRDREDDVEQGWQELVGLEGY